MKNFSSVRTMLFTPGNRPERFEKAKEVGADGVVIDLEDAVALTGKDAAREMAINYFKGTLPQDNFFRCLRINSMKTPPGLKDVTAILDSGIKPDMLIIPKTEYAAEIITLDLLLKTKGLSIPYIVLIETGIGILNAKKIASSSPNIKAICFGGGDLAADLGAVLEWEPMLVARSQVILAAATAGIEAFDVPYLKLKDTDDSGIIAETARVKALGFKGKFAIHPKQIKPIIDTFMPTPDEVNSAQRVVDAYKNANGNAVEIDGKMIDVPVVKSAERILALVNR